MFLSQLAFAHQFSTGYLNGEVEKNGFMQAQLELRVADLARAVDLDSDRNTQITWQEVLSASGDIEQFVSAGLVVRRAEADCGLALQQNWQVAEHFNEYYVQLPLRVLCGIKGDLSISYSGLFQRVSGHKLIVNIRNQHKNHSRVISESNPEIHISALRGSAWYSFLEYLRQGVIHIWIGLDHILFLLCLVLACVFQRKRPAQPTTESWFEALKKSSWLTLQVVTAFTVSHSLTLAATALDWIQLPSRWVEFIIAFSVAVAAINLLFPVARRMVAISFAFGLLHGMGFAGVLGELGLPAGLKVPSVLAFNLGVEFGQLVIVMLVLPLLVFLYRALKQPNYVRYAGSAVTLVIASVWLVDRFPI